MVQRAVSLSQCLTRGWIEVAAALAGCGEGARECAFARAGADIFLIGGGHFFRFLDCNYILNNELRLAWVT